MSKPVKVEPLEIIEKEEEKVEYRHAQVVDDEEIENHYDIWKFTRGDVIAMVIGGILGGIFSVSVIRLLGL